MAEILLLHRRFTVSGGTERVMQGFARFLRDAGHTPVIVAQVVEEAVRERVGAGVEICQIGGRARWSLAAKHHAFTRGVQAVLQARPRAWALTMGRTPGARVYRAGGGAHAAWLQLQGRWPPPWWAWAARDELARERATVAAARTVIANSQLAARHLHDTLGEVLRAPVEVVYNGVDAALFQPDPAAGAALRRAEGVEGPLAVFVGSDFQRKGLEVAMAALPPGWRLWVVGGGAPPPGAPPSVRFWGAQARPERFLQAATAMILPTRYDPCANACLEALACGVPALTTPHNGASELVPDAWMVADSVAGFTDALLRAEAEGPSLAARCRAAVAARSPEAAFSPLLTLLRAAHE